MKSQVRTEVSLAQLVWNKGLELMKVGKDERIDVQYAHTSLLFPLRKNIHLSRH